MEKRKTSEAGKIEYLKSDVFENAKFISVFPKLNSQWEKCFFQKIENTLFFYVKNVK